MAARDIISKQNQGPEMKTILRPVMPQHTLKYMGKPHPVWQPEQEYTVYIQLMSDKRYAVFRCQTGKHLETGHTIYKTEEDLKHAWDGVELFKPMLMQIWIDPKTGQEVQV